MFKKIIDIIKFVMFAFALVRAAQGWAYLIKDAYLELKFKMFGKNSGLTRYQYNR